MTIRKYIAHVVLLLAEISAFLAIILRPAFADGEWTMLVHYHWAAACGLTVFGLASVFLFFVAQLGLLRLDDADRKSWGAKALTGGLATMAVVCLVCAGRLIATEYPECFRSGGPLTGAGRIASLGGVVVHFDANNGTCRDAVRIVKQGAVYADNMNVYVLDDERNFAQLMNVRVNLPRNLLVLSVDNRSGMSAYAHYFSTNAVPLISKEGKWSYVVDIESMKGNVSDWYVGQTWSTNNNVYSYLEGSRIGSNDGKWRTKVLRLGISAWSEFNFLDRGVIVVGPEQSLDMAFRVSLFAGTGIGESNYRYVRPGETLACPLPVPTREGYVFEGWYDGERRITEESKVEKREPHTLKARWRKL